VIPLQTVDYYNCTVSSTFYTDLEHEIYIFSFRSILLVVSKLGECGVVSGLSDLGTAEGV
jgi:hypothetical protein